MEKYIGENIYEVINDIMCDEHILSLFDQKEDVDGDLYITEKNNGKVDLYSENSNKSIEFHLNSLDEIIKIVII